MGSVFESVLDSIDVVMGRVLASSAIDSRFEPRSGQTKDYVIVWCLSTIHAAIRSKIKDWLAWSQPDVSEWCDIFIYRLVSVSVSTIKSNTACSSNTKQIFLHAGC